MAAKWLRALMWVPLLLAACSGRTDFGPGGGGSCKDPGGCPDAGSICATGQTRTAPDGCNTCTCANGGWACTEKACPAPECTDGETKPAGDDCNTCSCAGGSWVCTQRACPPPQCTPGQTYPSPDGCNTCTCSNGQWSCTLKACPPPPPPQGKGCGGWLGQTCATDEYCAYVSGEYCGAADASSTCKKRPTICTDEYAPVCGCDGKTYSTACVAASAGTGVMSTGPCTAK